MHKILSATFIAPNIKRFSIEAPKIAKKRKAGQFVIIRISDVALNIAEGKERYSKKEFKQFLYISRGSLYETVALLALFKKLGWLPVEVCQKLYAQAEEISKMLSGLIASLTEEN